jgi:hypothetical protein
VRYPELQEMSLLPATSEFNIRTKEEIAYIESRKRQRVAKLARGSLEAITVENPQINTTIDCSDTGPLTSQETLRGEAQPGSASMLPPSSSSSESMSGYDAIQTSLVKDNPAKKRRMDTEMNTPGAFSVSPDFVVPSSKTNPSCILGERPLHGETPATKTKIMGRSCTSTALSELSGDHREDYFVFSRSPASSSAPIHPAAGIGETFFVDVQPHYSTNIKEWSTDSGPPASKPSQEKNFSQGATSSCGATSSQESTSPGSGKRG